MIQKEIIRILACPICQGDLNLVKNKGKEFLLCNQCNKKYFIIDNLIIFKAGIYIKPVVRPKNFSFNELKNEINKGKSKKYFKEFLGTKEEKEDSNFIPKGIIRKKLLKKLLDKSNVGKSKIHLDWATGSGRLLRYLLLKTKKPDIVAVDLDIRECAALQKYLRTRTDFGNRVIIVVADTREMPFKSDSFDSITTLWGLDEQVKPEKAVKESIRVLKQKKSLALSGALEKGSFKQIRHRLNKRIKDFLNIMNNMKKLKINTIKYGFVFNKEKINIISYIISGKK